MAKRRNVKMVFLGAVAFLTAIGVLKEGADFVAYHQNVARLGQAGKAQLPPAEAARLTKMVAAKEAAYDVDGGEVASHLRMIGLLAGVGALFGGVLAFAGQFLNSDDELLRKVYEKKWAEEADKLAANGRPRRD